MKIKAFLQFFLFIDQFYKHGHQKNWLNLFQPPAYSAIYLFMVLSFISIGIYQLHSRRPLKEEIFGQGLTNIISLSGRGGWGGVSRQCEEPVRQGQGVYWKRVKNVFMLKKLSCNKKFYKNAEKRENGVRWGGGLQRPKIV